MPRKPDAPAAVNSERGTMPSASHSRWCGPISFSTNCRKAWRNISCSSVKIVRRMAPSCPATHGREQRAAGDRPHGRPQMWTTGAEMHRRATDHHGVDAEPRPSCPRIASARTGTVARTMTPEDAAALLQPVDSLGMGLGPCHPQAFLEALGDAERLGEPADQRRLPRRVHRPVQPPQRPLPEPVLGPPRTVAAGERSQHRVRPGRLPAVHADHRAGAPAGDDHDRHAARRRWAVQPVAARRPHHPRAAAGGGRSRPPADRRARRRVPPHLRPAAAVPARTPRRRDRRGRALVGRRRSRCPRRRPGRRRRRSPSTSAS